MILTKKYWMCVNDANSRLSDEWARLSLRLTISIQFQSVGGIMLSLLLSWHSIHPFVDN